VRKKLQFLPIGLLLIATGVTQESPEVDTTPVLSAKEVGINSFSNSNALFTSKGTPDYRARVDGKDVPLPVKISRSLPKATVEFMR
jgi:hypothetical protein